MSASICPECRDGKPQNCTGEALDEATDEIVTCAGVKAPSNPEVPDLLAALSESIRKARAARVAHGTPADPHVVSPKARGWTTCANCFGAVFVCLQESGCDGLAIHDIRCNNQRYGVTTAGDLR